MDLVIRLRELRARAGLTQEQAAERSGIGAKTISSFESGSRIDAIKLSQLERLLDVYGVTFTHFFSDAFATELQSTVAAESSPIDAFRFEDLPEPVRISIAAWASRITRAHTAIARPLRPSGVAHAHVR
jgi:transcriptional regulator with XRE-family HTH domain